MSSHACVLCRATSSETVLATELAAGEARQPFRLERCTTCGLVRTEPRLAEDELQAFYPRAYYGTARPDDAAWVRQDQRHRTVFVERFVPEGGRVLDVGCGLGLFLLALDPARWERLGLEPSPAAFEEARRNLGAGRVASSEDRAAARGPFDAITYWDVLEHVPDPVHALARCAQRLRPGGHVLLSVPNFASAQARRFGESWYALSLPHHLHHFTPKTLRRVIERAGLEVVAIEAPYGREDVHAFRRSTKAALRRRHGVRAGRVLYYLTRPTLRLRAWWSARTGGGAHLFACARRRTGAS